MKRRSCDRVLFYVIVCTGRFAAGVEAAARWWQVAVEACGGGATLGAPENTLAERHLTVPTIADDPV